MFGEFESLPIVVVALIALAVVVVAFAASRYKIAKPNEALIIAGSRRARAHGGVRVVVGGGAIVYPLVNVARRVSLEIQSIAVALDGAVTIQGVPVAVEGIVNVKIADDENAIRQAAQRFLDTQKGIPEIVRNVMEGSLRTIIGQLTVEQLIRDREVFAARVQEVANSDLDGTGLAIDVFTIQSITDAEKYIENLGRKAAAEVRRDAEIAEAETLQAAREKQETSKQAILEAEKATRLKQQAIEQEVAAAEAKAEQSKPLAEAMARREVVQTETEVAVLVAARRDKELDAEIRRTADAQRYATEQGAEAERYRTVAAAEANAQTVRVNAEANAQSVRVNAEADKDRRLFEADAEQRNIEAVGRATADATLAVGQAEAEAMSKKADAYKEYEEAATLEMLISRLPDIARAVAEPIGNVKDMTIIGTEGASAIPRMAASTIKQLDGVLESFTGSSLSDLLGRFLRNGGNGHERREPAKAEPEPAQTE